MAIYKLVEGGIFDTQTNEFIPEDTNNIDYINYQIWVAEGNTPDDDGTKLSSLKCKKKCILHEKACEICHGGVLDGGIIYDTDSEIIFRESLIRENIRGRLDMEGTSWPIGAFSKSAILYRLLKANYDSIYSAIDAASTEQELDSIDVNAGWPSVPYS